MKEASQQLSVELILMHSRFESYSKFKSSIDALKELLIVKYADFKMNRISQNEFIAISYSMIDDFIDNLTPEMKRLFVKDMQMQIRYLINNDPTVKKIDA